MVVIRVVLGVVAAIFIWTLILVPTWIFLGAGFFLGKEEFRQGLSVFGNSLWFLSGLQIFLLVLGVILTFGAWKTMRDI